MKKNILAVCTLIALIFASCSFEKDRITINGTSLDNSISSYYLTQVLPDGERLIDSSECKNGAFQLSYTPTTDEGETPHFYKIHAQGDKIMTLAKKGETLQMVISGQPFSQNYDISGAEDAELMYQLDTSLLAFIHAIEKLENSYNKGRFNDTLKVQIEKSYLALVSQHQLFLQEFITKNAHSLATIPAFYQRYGRRIFLPETENIELLQKIYHTLQIQYPKSQDLLFIKKRAQISHKAQ